MVSMSYALEGTWELGRTGLRLVTFGVVLKSTLSSAWPRDITGLSNQALSDAATNPLVGTLDARPMGITGWRVVKVSRRSGSTK